jgi:hypothetical protein
MDSLMGKQQHGCKADIRWHAARGLPPARRTAVLVRVGSQKYVLPRMMQLRVHAPEAPRTLNEAEHSACLPRGPSGPPGPHASCACAAACPSRRPCSSCCHALMQEHGCMAAWLLVQERGCGVGACRMTAGAADVGNELGSEGGGHAPPPTLLLTSKQLCP